MADKSFYDISQWPVGNPHEDIGEILNSIISHIKSQQSDLDGGKPGGVIYIPVGDYRLATQVKIDISYLRIVGSGHGFTSSSIRFNVPEEDWPGLHELWIGGSRIMVDMPVKSGANESAGAAFYVERAEDPRISSVELSNFCIDGLHFAEESESLEVTTVLMEPSAVENTVMDSGTKSQVILDKTVNRFRADPEFAE